MIHLLLKITGVYQSFFPPKFMEFSSRTFPFYVLILCFFLLVDFNISLFVMSLILFDGKIGLYQEREFVKFLIF